MTAITARRYFGDLELAGLLALPGLLEVLVSAFNDEDVREAMECAAAAEAEMSGDCSAADYKAAEARMADAVDTLRRELARRRVRVGLQDAIDLREVLIEARLGQGRTDSWQARRRVA